MIRSLLTMIWQFSPVSFIILLRYFNGPGEIKGWVYRGGGGGGGGEGGYNILIFALSGDHVTVLQCIYVIVTMKWPYINLKNTSLYKLIHFILSKYFKFEGKSCYSHWELSCTQGNWILRIRFFFWRGHWGENSPVFFFHLCSPSKNAANCVSNCLTSLWYGNRFRVTIGFDRRRVVMMIIMLIHPTFLSIRYEDMIWIVKRLVGTVKSGT